MFLAAATAAHAQNAETIGFANVRSGPGMEFPIIAELTAGADVNVEECTGDNAWCYVLVPGPDGWVSASIINFNPIGGGPVPPADIPNGDSFFEPDADPFLEPGTDPFLAPDPDPVFTPAPAPKAPVPVTPPPRPDHLKVPEGVTLLTPAPTPAPESTPAAPTPDQSGPNGTGCPFVLGPNGFEQQCPDTEELSQAPAEAPPTAEPAPTDTPAQAPAEEPAPEPEPEASQPPAPEPQSAPQPEPEPETPVPGIACLFELNNYNGTRSCQNAPSVQRELAQWDNRFSSIQLAGSATRIILCTDAGFAGYCEYYDTSVAVLPPALNNRVSSAVVYTGALPANTLADGAATCQAGYVWREAFEGDRVCVTSAASQLAQNENRLSPSRTEAAEGDEPACKPGFVWREAGPDDRVCVTPARKAAVAAENEAAASKRIVP